MNKVEWYYNRFKTMSIAEVGYRVKQKLGSYLEKFELIVVRHQRVDYKKLVESLKCKAYEAIPETKGSEFLDYSNFNFFGTSISLLGEIDWHLDVLSGKRFPLAFAKDIDIRSGQFGSAKVVWEINRLQFLLPLALKYNLTRKEEDLINFTRQVESWINANPYLKGVNWYSNIEVNIRLIVWYFCWQVLFQIGGISEKKWFMNFVETRWLPAIYEHCVYSYKNPSRYSSANNHLISEYSGLFVASCLWDFEESTKWNRYAKAGLEKEIVLQHSINGVNKEEAAEYIQFITDFFLIPLAVGKKYNISFSDTFNEYLLNISNYIYHLLDSGGSYCKYGDDDDGKVLVTSSDSHFNNFLSILISSAVLYDKPEFKKLDAIYDLKNFLLFGEAGFDTFNGLKASGDLRETMLLEDDGHFLFRKETAEHEIYLHFDAAPLGFLSIAAHGHADALSFCLHLDGHPFIVDPGAYTYHTEPEWRRYFVSTLAHNTVCIDRLNQAYQAGPTMWLRHFKNKVLGVVQTFELDVVEASNDGYKSIGCNHTRKISFNKSDEVIVIDDAIEVSEGGHLIEMAFHFHSDVLVEHTQEENKWIVENKHCKRKLLLTIDKNLVSKLFHGEMDPIMGWVSPAFLVKVPSPSLIGFLTTEKTERFTTTIKVI